MLWCGYTHRTASRFTASFLGQGAEFNAFSPTSAMFAPMRRRKALTPSRSYGLPASRVSQNKSAGPANRQPGATGDLTLPGWGPCRPASRVRAARLAVGDIGPSGKSQLIAAHAL